MGTSGSNLMKINHEAGNKHNVISINNGSLAETMDAPNFERDSFMVSPTTDQMGRGLACYYGQIRKKEKKFYIICQGRHTAVPVYREMKILCLRKGR